MGTKATVHRTLCDGTRDAVQKILRDLASSQGGKTTESTADDKDGEVENDVAGGAGVEEMLAGADGGEEEVEPLAPLSQRYTLNPSLALGPAVLVADPEPVVMFPLEVSEEAVEGVCGGGGFHGEWHVFENGVTFAPRQAPVVPLVFGANVTSVSVHDGIDSSTSGSSGETVDATEAVVVFQLAEGAAAAVPPMHLCGDGAASGGMLCFSLAPMGLKSRRHFLREVIPKWKAAAKEAGITCDGGDTYNVLATSSTTLSSKAII